MKFMECLLGGLRNWKKSLIPKIPKIFKEDSEDLLGPLEVGDKVIGRSLSEAKKYSGVTDFSNLERVQEKIVGKIGVVESLGDSGGALHFLKIKWDDGSPSQSAGYYEWRVEKVHKCGVCGEEGHNQRTCPTLKEGEKVETKKVTIWELTERVIPHSRITLLYGPPGTGKTTVANRNRKDNQTVYNITLTEETPAAELRGHFIPRGGEFVWQHGPGMMAFIDGGRLVLNEIDKASGDCMTFCHALLDDPEIARITLPTGETIYPHEDYSVVATMNGEPDDLPEALRDRFSVALHINKLHPEAVRSLPVDLRNPAKKGVSGDESRRVSVRAWKAYAHLREALGIDSLAAQAVFGVRAETILNTIKLSEDKKSAKTTLVTGTMGGSG